MGFCVFFTFWLLGTSVASRKLSLVFCHLIRPLRTDLSTTEEEAKQKCAHGKAERKLRIPGSTHIINTVIDNGFGNIPILQKQVKERESTMNTTQHTKKYLHKEVSPNTV